MLGSLLSRVTGGAKTKKNTPSVLVVDDEKEIRNLIGLHLKKLDCKVVSAASAAEAMEKIEEGGRWKCAILDIKMAGENGVVLAKRLRKHAKTKKVPILFISGHVPPSRLEKLKSDMENVEVLTKPFRGPDLVKIVEKALRGGEKGEA